MNSESEVKSKEKPRKGAAPTPSEIDAWKFPSLSPEQLKGAFLAESSFATLFPKYREKYIKETIGIVQKELAKNGIKLELDIAEGSLTVRTTKRTWDPYAIVKARDVIKLIARSVPYQVALRVMEPETYCDIIKIKNATRSKERYVKRRARLIGPDGGTLKCLEILTECYILVQGSTVCVVGHYRKLKQVRRIVEEVMANTHPLYHIKELMIKRELEKDEKLRGENWDRFLPQFARINSVRRKIARKTRVRSPFPNPPTPRKEDIAIASGEYFLSEQQKKAKNVERKREAQSEARKKRVAEREKSFEPPKEELRPPIVEEKKTDISSLLRRFKIPQINA